jgi:hypothetical protein
MRLIAAGLATLVLTGAASVAVATEAAAATPLFRCENKAGDVYPLGPKDRLIPAIEKSEAQKAGFFRCFKQ